MVKLNGPLMSQNASGAFAKNLTFQTRGNKKLVRRFHYPKKQPTGEQIELLQIHLCFFALLLLLHIDLMVR